MQPHAGDGKSHFIIDDQREQFVRDGFVRVSGLIPAATVGSTRQALAEALGLDEDARDDGGPRSCRS